MTHAFMNGGAPLTEGQHAGKIGVTITFSDGGTQNVYAGSKDELFDKVMSMYGNTRERNRELQEAGRQPKPAEETPAPVGHTRLTPDQKLAVVEELQDPNKAGEAIAKLVKDATGMDLEAEARQREAQARIERRRVVCEEFVAQTPDWYGSKRNATLLRDRVAAVYGTDEATAANYVEAYDYLKHLGVLESAPVQQETRPEGHPAEPSAPPPQRPSGTGAPPSRLRGASTPAPAQRETLEDILRLDPSEHERRLRNEPGYLEKVQRLYEQKTA